MKMPVDSTTTIHSIPKETRTIHLIRPISISLLEKILDKCRNLKEISLSSSTHKRLSKKHFSLLEKKNIPLKLTQNSGRAISIDMEKLLELVDLKKYFLSLRKIEEKTGIPKSTIHYLLKYAKRNKLKNGKKTVYIQ